MKVLVLNASAMHIGFLGFYGNSWVATPKLDRLAAESVVFDQHFAEVLTAQAAARPDILANLEQHDIAVDWVSKVERGAWSVERDNVPTDWASAAMDSDAPAENHLEITMAAALPSRSPVPIEPPTATMVIWPADS